MCATLRAASSEFTRPMNSRMIFGLLPAASTMLGAAISVGMPNMIGSLAPLGRGRKEDSRRRQLFAQLPIVAKRVGDAAGAPAILFVDLGDRHGASGDGLGEELIGVVDGQDQAHAAWAAGFRHGFRVALDP